jgi:hypothetical protein
LVFIVEDTSFGIGFRAGDMSAGVIGAYTLFAEACGATGLVIFAASIGEALSFDTELFVGAV